MRIYHVERDHAHTLNEQKKALAAEFKDFTYLYCCQNVITFMASERK